MPYLLFFIPLLLAAVAVRTDFYPAKAGVTLSCMGILIYYGVSRGYPDRTYWLILAAFLLSVGGDFFLSHRSVEGEEKAGWFVYGIGLFFVAHVFYLAFAAGNSRFPVFLFIPLLLVLGVYYLFRIKPRIKDPALKGAVFFYMVISSLSFSLAWGYGDGTAGNLFFILGIGLIVFSDICIAESVFAGLEFLDKLILPTYYAAHMAIALGLILP